jgi:hypothetical protein
MTRTMVWYVVNYGLVCLVCYGLVSGKLQYGLVWSMNSTKMIQFDICLVTGVSPRADLRNINS